MTDDQPKLGRPSKYTPEIAETICDRLAGGESLRAVCRDEGMPSEPTVRRWALDDLNGFSAQYTKAREVGYLGMADELLEIADYGVNDTTVDQEGNKRVDFDVIQRSRLRVDTRKWLLSKMLPKVFGDKLELEHTPPLRSLSDEKLDAAIAAIEKMTNQQPAGGADD